MLLYNRLIICLFYVESKTSIALVCDEKEIGKVDAMNSDSSLYVSTKYTGQIQGLRVLRDVLDLRDLRYYTSPSTSRLCTKH